MKRLISKRHFEKVKVLFGVNTIEEIKQLFETFSDEINKHMRYTTTFSYVAPLSHHINYKEIGTSI